MGRLCFAAALGVVALGCVSTEGLSTGDTEVTAGPDGGGAATDRGSAATDGGSATTDGRSTAADASAYAGDAAIEASVHWCTDVTPRPLVCEDFDVAPLPGAFDSVRMRAGT